MGAYGEATYRLSARVARASGEPFLPHDEELHDPGVVRDTVRWLTPRVEAVVLRVAASGDVGADGDDLDRDWLLRPDGSPPMPVPQPRWGFGRESEAWSLARRWVDAWETCHNGCWMAHAAEEVGVPAADLLAALCRLASSAASSAGVSETSASLPGDVASLCRRGARISPEDVARVAAATREAHAEAMALAGSIHRRTCAAAMSRRHVGALFGSWRGGGDFGGNAWIVASNYAVAVSPDPSRKADGLRAAARVMRESVGTLDVVEAAIRTERRRTRGGR